jgi:hypothetical protein
MRNKPLHILSFLIAFFSPVSGSAKTGNVLTRKFNGARSIWRTLTLIMIVITALVLVPCAADAAVPVVENDYTFTATPANSPTNEITLTKPAGLAVGDLALVFVSSDSDQGPEWNTKTGWTRLINCGTSSTNTVTGIYYRIADGTEGSTETFTQTNNDDLMGYWIRISGVDTSDPIHATTSCQQQTTTTPDIAGFNTTKDDVLAMWFLSFDGADFRDAGGQATGSGWPTDFIDGHTAGGDGTDIGGGWSYKDMPSQGATGTVEVDADHSDGASFVQIGINPASAPPDLQQVHYRWRNNNGGESAASCTGTDTFTTPGSDSLVIDSSKNGCTATITVKGGGGEAGGGSGGSDGGAGGGTVFDYVIPSAGTFDIYVGEGGNGRSPNLGGGGGSDNYAGGSGGGASAIKYNGTLLAIAGGGGGGGV